MRQNERMMVRWKSYFFYKTTLELTLIITIPFVIVTAEGGGGWCGRRRPGGCHVGFSSRLAWWVAQTKQGIKIVFFSTKQLKLTLRKHRPFRHRYYRGGARVGVAGGGQKGCRTLLQIWCDGRCNPCEVRGILDSGLKWSMSYIGLHYLNVINVTNGLYNLFQIIFDVRWE